MSAAGMNFWDVLAASRNFSGIYCMGLHTKDASCTDPKMTIGSAADSMYEYMLKQWVLCGGKQEVSNAGCYFGALSCVQSCPCCACPCVHKQVCAHDLVWLCCC
jgi:hypothetical protein